MAATIKDLLYGKLTVPVLILGTAVTLILGQFITNWIATTIYPGFPHYQAGIGVQALCYLAAGVIFFWTAENIRPSAPREGLSFIFLAGIIFMLFAAFVGWYFIPNFLPSLGPYMSVVSPNFNIAPFAVVPLGP